MSKSEKKHIFVTYIKTSKEKLWLALTDGELTRKYFFNSSIKGQLKEGLEFEYVDNDKVKIECKTLEIIPNEKLVHEFHFPHQEEDPSRVTYEIDEKDGLCKLTLTHDQFDKNSKAYDGVFKGWPLILSGLKTFLETGNTLDYGIFANTNQI